MSIPLYKLRLSVQRALLGNISPKLRAVCVHTEKNEIYVYFYYDGEISDEDKELAQSALDDIISDFHIDEEGNDMEFITPILRVDFPHKMELHGDWYTFVMRNRVIA